MSRAGGQSSTFMTHPARYWHREGERVVCTACPRLCRMSEGQHGFCYVRKHEGGALVSLAYGQPNAVAVDPIEKKPLWHFLPGTTILSIGTAGCNLGCRFCQNWDLSKAKSHHKRALELAPEDVPQLARREGAASVAFTYNDPTIYPEYVIDAARAARAAGVAAVGVTAGYISDAARADMYPQLDALNIDLKGFSERFYHKLTFSHLQPVLETIEWSVKRGLWVELTTLVIPGHNDDPEELRAQFRWIADHLGPDVPLHLTAFHPDYKLQDVPATPPETLIRARDEARAFGLRFVYTGNIWDRVGSVTACPACDLPLIERRWHAVTANRVRVDGTCPGCGAKLPGVFDARSQSRSPGRRYHLL
jgi:pyruvate formate lyase activating enzyme